jgi:large subunit ribosomal protein L23
MAEKTTTKKSVLLSPRLTEKAALAQNKQNVYVFNVSLDANKKSVEQSIKAEYKVTPLKVRMTRIASKPLMFRGRPGKKSAGKKAYVYLKKGDTIAI